jgi:hypothetical protein
MKKRKYNGVKIEAESLGHRGRSEKPRWGDPALFSLLRPLDAKRLMEPVANGVGKGKELSVAIEFDGLARRVYHHTAFVALLQMRIQLSLQVLIEVPV